MDEKNRFSSPPPVLRVSTAWYKLTSSLRVSISGIWVTVWWTVVLNSLRFWALLVARFEKYFLGQGVLLHNARLGAVLWAQTEYLQPGHEQKHKKEGKEKKKQQPWVLFYYKECLLEQIQSPTEAETSWWKCFFFFFCVDSTVTYIFIELIFHFEGGNKKSKNG